MSLTIPCSSASSDATASFEYRLGNETVIVVAGGPMPSSGGALPVFFATPIHANLPAGFLSVESAARRWESKPGRAERMQQARTRMASRLSQDTQGRLTVQQLRLRAGLSQSALAAAIKTSQPHLSLIEQGNAEVKFGTLIKLRDALKCSLDELAEALQADTEARSA